MTALIAVMSACSQGSFSPADPEAHVFEAEWAQAAISGAWGLERDADASSQLSVIAAPPGSVTIASFDDATIPFVTEQAAQYIAYLRVSVPAGASDAIDFGIDGAKDAIPVGEFDRYVWVAGPPRPLTAGAHAVTLAPPAAGVRYDLVVVAPEAMDAAQLDAFVKSEAAEPGEVPPPPEGPGEGPAAPTEPGVPAASGASGLPDDPFYAAVRAFPGAEGYGANATGGRGGELMFITNLNDSGPGSARAAFEAAGKRYIVPLVWGYVDLQAGIDVRNGDVTYAGQFMPDGQGLVFRNMRSKDWVSAIQASIYLRGADNAILRYLKVYRGINSGYEEGNGDAVTIYQTQDVIVDRASIAFGNDENLNVQSSSTSNVTVQHSWLLEPLHKSTHTKTLEDGIRHGAALLVAAASKVTLSHNFMYRSGMRAPKITAEGPVDIVNNFDYNNLDPLRMEARYTLAANQEDAMRVNLIANLRELGPASRDPAKTYGMSIDQYDPSEAKPTAYLEGNIHPFRPTDGDTSLAGQWKGVNTGQYGGAVRLKSRVDTPAVRTTDALQAKDEILAYGGPSFVLRDGVLTDVRDPLMRAAAEAARTGGGPSDMVDGWGTGKNWKWPEIPEGGISVDAFWDDYFDPWRDAQYPGASWDDTVGGYQVIELFLNAWVPDFVALSR